MKLLNVKKRKQLIIIALLLVFLTSSYFFTGQTVGNYTVYQVLSDYQDQPNGGNGWLRILTFSPFSDVLYTQTFSPYLNEYMTDDNSQFTIPYPLINGSNPFTIIVLPDAQYYSSRRPDIFLNQTNWIAQNKEALNIVFVVQLGDIVDSYPVTQQWENSRQAMDVLGANGIPATVCVGNHDFDLIADKTQSNFYHYYAPYNIYNPYYAGSYNNDNFNSYSLLNIDGNQILILCLQFFPTIEAQQWAKTVLLHNPSYTAILCTHSFLNPFGIRDTIGDDLFTRVIVPNADQVHLVLCGHYSGESSRLGSIFGGSHEAMRSDRIWK